MRFGSHISSLSTQMPVYSAKNRAVPFLTYTIDPIFPIIALDYAVKAK